MYTPTKQFIKNRLCDNSHKNSCHNATPQTSLKYKLLTKIQPKLSYQVENFGQPHKNKKHSLIHLGIKDSNIKFVTNITTIPKHARKYKKRTANMQWNQ